MNYEFHPEALAQYEAGAHYWAQQPEGLDLRFINSVEGAIRKILAAPERWRAFDDDIRRCLTQTFPYGILYTIEPDFVLIIAVAHCSREPGYWKHKVSGKR